MNALKNWFILIKVQAVFYLVHPDFSQFIQAHMKVKVSFGKYVISNGRNCFLLHVGLFGDIKADWNWALHFKPHLCQIHRNEEPIMSFKHL